MRNVVRSYLIGDAPAILQLASTIAASTAIAISGNAGDIKRAIYSDPYDAGVDEGIQSRVIDRLNHWYHGKCAYCERYYKLDVEHFRPKGEVRGEDNALIRNTGYYWLGYEWSNLLPACISCNRDGGKYSKFPYIAGGQPVNAPRYDPIGNLDRTFCFINHQDLAGERPALLHPEMDANLENYFGFEVDQQLEGIRITGTDADRRGEITINICNLNREETRLDRLQGVVMDLVNSIESAIALLARIRNNQIFALLLEQHFDKVMADRGQPRLSHTLLRRYMVASADNFDAIVLPFVNPGFRQILSHAFRQYLARTAVPAPVPAAANPLPVAGTGP